MASTTPGEDSGELERAALLAQQRRPATPSAPVEASTPAPKLGETDRAAAESERQQAAANQNAAQRAKEAEADREREAEAAREARARAEDERASARTLGEGEAEIQAQRFVGPGGAEVAEPKAIRVKSVGEGEDETVRFVGPGGVEVAEPTRIVAGPSSGRTDIAAEETEISDRAARIAAAEKTRLEAEQPIRMVDGKLIVDLSKSPPKGSTPAIANFTRATPEETARANRALLGIIPVVGTVIGGVELAKTWDQLSTSERVKASGLQALSVAGDLLIVGQGASVALRAVSTSARAGAAGKVAAETVLTVGKADEAAGFAAQAAKTGRPVSVDVIAANPGKAAKDLQTVIERNPALSEVRVVTGSTVVGSGKSAVQAAEEVAAAQAARTGVKAGTVDIRSAVPEFKTTAGRLPNATEVKNADRILGDLEAARTAKAAEIAKESPVIAGAQADARAALEAAQATVTKLRQAGAPAADVNAAAAKVPKLADAVVAANARAAEQAAEAAKLKTPTSVVMVVERAPSPADIKNIVGAMKESDNIRAVKIEHNNPFKNTGADIKFDAVNEAVKKIDPGAVRKVKVAGKDVDVPPIDRKAFDAVGDVANKSVPEVVKELRAVSAKQGTTLEKGWGVNTPTGKAIAAAEKNADDFNRAVDKLASGIQRGGVAAEKAGAKPFLKVEKTDTSVTVKPKPGDVEVVRRIRIEGDGGGGAPRRAPKGEIPKDGGGRVAVATRSAPVVRAVSSEASLGRRLIRTGGAARPRVLPVVPVPGGPGRTIPAPPARGVPPPIREPGQPLRVPGGRPVTPPGRLPDRQPGRQPATTPVRHPGTGPARAPGTGPATRPGTGPTTGPGRQPGGQPGTIPGTGPGTGPGPGPGRQPGAGTGTGPGTGTAIETGAAPGAGPEPARLPDPEFQPVPAPAPEPTGEKLRVPDPTVTRAPGRDTSRLPPPLPRKGTVVLRYKSPPGKPIPQQVAFGLGVVESRVFLQSGKRVSARDLSTAIPNVPTRKPSETFIIERFGKAPIKAPTVIQSGVVKAVIDPTAKTITFLPRKKVDLT